MTVRSRGFASDNCSGIHPEILAAIAAANVAHQPSYGLDAPTDTLAQVLHQHFGPEAVGFPVFTGTGANLVALRAMTSRWGSVLCTDTAHIYNDEGGGPEQIASLKLVPAAAYGGKLEPAHVTSFSQTTGRVHSAQPQVISLTQPTEWGLVYTVDELRALCDAAHEQGLLVHLDGARLCNAAAALDVSLRSLTADAGVDVLSLGGTKLGLLAGEVIVALRSDLAKPLEYVRKSTAQLASKQRFLSAELVALLGGDLWQRLARHGNAMAQLMADALAGITDVTIVFPTQTNAVFVRFDPAVAQQLARQIPVQINDPETGLVRLMMSFDTTEQDIEALVRAVHVEADSIYAAPRLTSPR